MKKIIAALMCIVLLLGLAACSKPAQEPVGNTGNNDNSISTPEMHGMLTLNMNVVINIAYDKEGFVLDVASGNEMADEILGGISPITGVSCSKLVCDIITAIEETSYALDQNAVLLKQVAGSKVPSETFLATIQAEAEKLIGERTLLLVTVDQLDENGYLSLDCAKEYLAAQLKVDLSAISGDPILQDGRFWFTVEKETGFVDYIMDGELGLIEEQPAEPVIETEPIDDTAGDSDLGVIETMPEDFDPMLEIPTEYTVDDSTDPAMDPTEDTTLGA